MKTSITSAIGLAVVLSVASAALLAQEQVSFKGKTITMIVGSPAGGGTDSSARLIALLLTDRLSGKPTLIVRNVPGAEGMTAMNYFARQVAPDGFTLVMGSTTQADPMLYRRPQAQFDPTKFSPIGGVGRGGTVLLIRKEAEARLHDRSAKPVVMGALSGVPRSGMQMTAWGVAYLDWNAKWVLGYRGTKDLMLALVRGEIDMTTTANLFEVQEFLASGKYKLVAQSGTLQNGQVIPRPEFGDAPVFATLIQGRIKDPTMQKGLDYWASLTALDKWLALPPGSPQPYLRAYREAFDLASRSPEFSDLGRKISQDIEPMPHEDVKFLIDRLGRTPPEAIAAISTMLRKQGIEAE
jgi:tripartite-type tricarboxylate transporter receptor subunit TctC